MTNTISSFSDIFKFLADEATMGILVFNTDNQKCVYSNHLAVELLDWPTNQNISERSLEELFPPSDNAKLRVLNSEIVSQEGLYQDITIKKANGMNIITNLGVKIVEVGQVTHKVLMFQDITIQKKLQRDITTKQIEINAAFEKLLKQNHQLKDLDAAKDKFIALTTHELKTPLSAMVASSEILKMKLYDDEDQLQEFIDMIYDQGLHLQNLVNDILDFAKIQANKMEYYVEHLDIVPVVTNIVTSFEKMASTDKIDIQLDLPEEEFKCYFDAIRIRQVLSNVVNNSIKYNKKNGYVKVRLTLDDEFVRVYVEDSGKGIDEKQLDLVFNEFETLGKVALHHQGTGLGMPISKRIMEAMGGAIMVESELDRGSIFWLEIPTEKVLDGDLYRTRPDSSGDLAA